MGHLFASIRVEDHIYFAKRFKVLVGLDRLLYTSAFKASGPEGVDSKSL